MQKSSKPLVLVASRDDIWLAEIGDRLTRVNGIVVPMTSEDEIIKKIDNLNDRIDLIILEDEFMQVIPLLVKLRGKHPALILLGCAEEEHSRRRMLDLGCSESSASLCPHFFSRITEIVERLNIMAVAN